MVLVVSQILCHYGLGFSSGGKLARLIAIFVFDVRELRLVNIVFDI